MRQKRYLYFLITMSDILLIIVQIFILCSRTECKMLIQNLLYPPDISPILPMK